MNGYLRNIFIAAAVSATSFAYAEPTESMKKLMDFEAENGALKWAAVNDDVMGGISRGGSVVKDGALVFSGKLSLENNGGFASVRTEDDYDFSGEMGSVCKS